MIERFCLTLLVYFSCKGERANSESNLSRQEALEALSTAKKVSLYISELSGEASHFNLKAKPSESIHQKILGGSGGGLGTSQFDVIRV